MVVIRSKVIKLPIGQTWELLTDRQAQRHWLGRSSTIGQKVGDRVAFGDMDGSVCSGAVQHIAHYEIVCSIDHGDVDGVPTTSRLAISAKSSGDGGSVVVIHTAVQPGEALALNAAYWDQFWVDALGRMLTLSKRITARKRSLRQALIVVHGIGEQEPGTTLRALVDGVLDPAPPDRRDEDRQSWWKPDRTSRLFELRRVTLKATSRQRRPTTDVFELYWAHLIRDTTAANVGSWLRHLVLRWSVPRRFVAIWLLFWVAVVCVISIATATFFGWDFPQVEWLAASGALVSVVLAAWRYAGKGLVVNSLGDAARYLAPRPGNIGHRQVIREEGIELLDRLHRSGRYDRIVVLGHSLGSVIAYDIITYYWIMRGHEHSNLASIENSAAIAVNKALKANPPSSPAAAQELQFAAWIAARKNGQPWLISDFVTIGSPLSMGEFLMASRRAEFERGKLERRIPTCPPQVETSRQTKHALATYSVTYADRGGSPSRTLEVFHHGAPFALTRWTNLYFPPTLLRDPIGGPVGTQFGDWIADVPLEPPDGRRLNLHSTYWRPARSNDHISALLDALKLGIGKKLRVAKEDHSPLLYLPSDEDEAEA